MILSDHRFSSEEKTVPLPELKHSKEYNINFAFFPNMWGKLVILRWDIFLNELNGKPQTCEKQTGILGFEHDDTLNHERECHFYLMCLLA